MFAREVYTDLHDLAAVSDKRFGVTLVFNLLQGNVRILIVFELEDIDVVLCFHDHVDATVGNGSFHLGVEAEQLRDDVKRILELQFGVAYDLVVRVGEEHLHALHKLLRLTVAQSEHKVADIHRRSLAAGMSIVG